MVKVLVGRAAVTLPVWDVVRWTTCEIFTLARHRFDSGTSHEYGDCQFESDLLAQQARSGGWEYPPYAELSGLGRCVALVQG
jgi:hypothetical protein